MASNEETADTGLLIGIREALTAQADPQRAEQQQRYMKSKLPYHGLPNPLVQLICRELFAVHPVPDRATWVATALTLWDEATHREEWYAAINLLRHRPYRCWAQLPESLSLYQHLITTGAWWDVVDEVAAHLVGDLVREHHAQISPVMRAWASDADPWLRRTAIICQLRSKDDTDVDLLADAIEANLSQTGFFLRKAIGWALRDFARTDPDWVREFVRTHESSLSGLSTREALKHLGPL